MKQFTNKLDFSLTLKRFRKMNSRKSPFRVFLSVSLVVPIVLVLGIASCSNHNNPDRLYSNMQLSIEPKGALMSQNSRFTQGGVPFTGIEKYTDKEGNLFSEHVYEDGKIVETKWYNFEETPLETSYYGVLEGRRITLRRMTRNGIALEETILPSETGTGLGKEIKRFKNGVVKFEAEFKNYFVYEGLMTLYNESGNILNQELFENGELVEKIK